MIIIINLIIYYVPYYIIVYLYFLFFSGFVVAERNRQSPRLPNFKNRLRTTTEVTSIEEEDYIATPECPEPDGFFAHPEQCDKYYACK